MSARAPADEKRFSEDGRDVLVNFLMEPGEEVSGASGKASPGRKKIPNSREEINIKITVNQQQENSNSLWMYNPALDLIVGCGAWSAPLLLLSYFSMASSARAWAVAFYALALAFNYPHYMATIYRAYHREEDFHKYRVFTVHITALILLTLLLAHFWPRILPWIFTLYLTWSPWHYSGQNYGLFMMFARRAGATPTENERRILYSAFIVSYLILFLGFHTGSSGDPLFISIGIPAAISKWEQIVLIVGFAALSVFGISRVARSTGWRKLLPALTLYSSQVLWFFLPALISLLKNAEIPQSRYSSGVLAVMHSAQYLWITSYYARREALGERKRPWRPIAYFAVLIAGGIALFVPGPWLASRVFHHDFTASFLIFTALVNIHHFILDGAIWKLRDGRIAALLLNSRDRLTDAASHTTSVLSSAWRWTIGSDPAAHRLRVSAAALLLIFGTLDQARYYLALRHDNLGDLQRAASLDPFDSSVQMHLAEQELADGNAPLAEAAWKRAIQANPADPAPRQALLHFFVDANRFDEAYELTVSSLKLTPNDANLLVDAGFLAMHRGRSAEALADWDRAITVDPTQVVAHLYLADELDRENQPRLAAVHYEAFLKKTAQQSHFIPVQPSAAQDASHKSSHAEDSLPTPDKVIAIVLKMADCQARALETEQALQSYHLAERLADQTRQPKLESVADVNEAALITKSGRTGEALRLYQQALQIDEALGDDRAVAQDWFAYGQFLYDAGFSRRLAYACLAKAATMAQFSAGAIGDPSPALRQRLEKELGGQAVVIARNLEPTLREARTFRP
jgi:tetratricopeptide (TPR) repeat protein